MSAGLFMVRSVVCYANHPNAPKLQECLLIGLFAWKLMPTYESWIVRRESWLRPFPLTRRYDRDRDATSRFEE